MGSTYRMSRGLKSLRGMLPLSKGNDSNCVNKGRTAFPSACHLKFISPVQEVRQLSSFHLKPERPSVDEPFELEVGQLVPTSDVSLQISIPSFASQSPFLTPKLHLKAGHDGKAILPNTMDLLTCMEGKGRFYVSGPIANDLEYTVTVEGVGEGILRRRVYSENVRRVELGGGKAGQVQGTLFLPKIPGPGVLCLSGAGGAREDTAAFLAGKGFTTLALAFFGAPGLPRNYASLPLEYFEAAIDLLGGHCREGEGVGVVGSSKGGDLALALAVTQGPKVRVAVTVNGCLGSAGGEMKKEGRTIFPAIGVRPDFIPKLREDGTLSFLGCMEELSTDTTIPLEKAQAELLIIAGEDDHNWESVRYAQMAEKRCSQAGKKDIRIETLPYLGHTVELPFTPTTTSIRHAMLPRGSPQVYMGGGGDRAKAGRAQAKATNIFLTFLE